MKPWKDDETFLARWVSNDLTEEELRLFEASPDYQQYVDTVSSLDSFEVSDYDEQAALLKIKSRIASSSNTKSKQVYLKQWLYYAAAACVLILVGISVYPSSSEITEIVAEQVENIELPDGSKVRLNKGSIAQYDAKHWEKKRELTLYGEAYFDIAKGKKFDILLQEGRVSILGTSFNIKENTDSIVVVCYTGKVEVSAFGEQTILTPGEKVIAINGQPLKEVKTNLIQPLWISDMIVLREVHLRKALDHLKEIYDISIQGEIDENQIYSGAFPINDVETALKQILGPYSIRYQLDDVNHNVIIE